MMIGQPNCRAIAIYFISQTATPQFSTDINRQDAHRAKIKNLFYMLVTSDSAANLCGS
jgi:hypothetical protein